MTHTVVGLFEDRSHAQAAMNELIAEGFVKEHIDISNRRFAGSDDDQYAITEDTTDSTGTGEGIGDRISNFFSNLFSDDESTARSYANAASDADAILTVQVDSEERAETAREIFDRHDAMDVDEHGSSNYGMTGGTATGMTGATAAGRNIDNDTNLTDRQTIPVVEENLNVSKREVERGGARVRSRIINRPVEENVRLREEHVVVNRRPVDREITDSDMKNFRPGEMELTEKAEVPIVGKEARVVEEVEIGKNVTEREETVRDSVRSTEVEVDKIDSSETNTKANRARR
jgi:stress response protein YsnF